METKSVGKRWLTPPHQLSNFLPQSLFHHPVSLGCPQKRVPSLFLLALRQYFIHSRSPMCSTLWPALCRNVRRKAGFYTCSRAVTEMEKSSLNYSFHEPACDPKQRLSTEGISGHGLAQWEILKPGETSLVTLGNNLSHQFMRLASASYIKWNVLSHAF